MVFIRVFYFYVGADFYLYMFSADLVVFLLTIAFFDDFSGQLDQDLEFVRAGAGISKAIPFAL